MKAEWTNACSTEVSWKLPVRNSYRAVVEILSGGIPIFYTDRNGQPQKHTINRIPAYLNRSVPGELYMSGGVLHFQSDRGTRQVTGPQEMAGVAMSQPYGKSWKIPLTAISIPSHIAAILDTSYKAFKDVKVYYHDADDRQARLEKKSLITKDVEKYLQVLWLMVTHMDYDWLEVTRGNGQNYSKLSLIARFPTEDKIVYTVKQWFDELVDNQRFGGAPLRPSLATPSVISWRADLKGEANVPGFDFFVSLVKKLKEYQGSRANLPTTALSDLSLLERIAEKKQGVYVDAEFSLLHAAHTFLYESRMGVLMNRPKRKPGMRAQFASFETAVYF